MEVSRIGSRFYENAAQSGKKVKGKQQDGFAYELQKSYDEKYRSEDTDETGKGSGGRRRFIQSGVSL